MSLLFNLEMHAGETIRLVVRLTNQAGLPINLTGALIQYRAETPIAIVKTVGAGIIIESAVGGHFVIVFTQAETLAITRSLAADHELVVRLAAGDRTTVFYGQAKLHRSIVPAI